MKLEGSLKVDGTVIVDGTVNIPGLGAPGTGMPLLPPPPPPPVLPPMPELPALPALPGLPGLDALTQPIVDLVGLFGNGLMSGGGPAALLQAASAGIDSVHSLGGSALAELDAVWTGPGSEGAKAKGHEVQRASVDLSDRGQGMSVIVNQAAAKVEAGVAELTAILQSFITAAVASAPALLTPAGQTMLIGLAVDHLAKAAAVVGRVRTELAVHTAEMTGYADQPPMPSAPGVDGLPSLSTTATGVSSPQSPLAAIGQGFTSGLGSSGTGMPASMAGVGDSNAFAGGGARGIGGVIPHPGRGAGAGAGAGAGIQGNGVEIFLPDGSTAIAPNEASANAVRNALSQQGVPYSWGGTEPGVGMDCSGLTKWAYGEAGVDLPRLAQEQSVGAVVDPSRLMPGDLAVWDGHVAMVIGGGQMVEAGDPVSVSAVRTDNIGMGFYGFYRPTG